jgi:UDP-GlcNAc:undecaprenyl-phosphate/decaprenyl-phosphate GlcNAc-1-phosphate transferase
VISGWELAVASGAAFVAAAVLTPLCRTLAKRLGVVARPAPDRWHKQPTALLGGGAILLASVVGLTVGAGVLGHRWRVEASGVVPGAVVGVGLCAMFMFVVGVIDDVRHLRPQLKFILQTLAGVVLVSFGGVLALTPWYGANVVITLFWFVGVTNAFNLLDNMDGVAAGVAAIASLFLGLALADRGAWLPASVAWSLTGASLGFLRYNFPPASIFMGDGGSLFLGSALAGLAVSSPSASPASGSLVSVLFVPVMIMAVPILDTTLVTLTRAFSGRAISQGGRDHTAHRLIALGLGERQVAVLLYGCAAVCGLVALRVTRVDHGLGVFLGTTVLVAMGLIAAYLGRLRVAYSGEAREPGGVTVLVGNLLYKKRLAEILLDVVLVTLAYYGAYRLRFDGALPPAYVETFQASVGIVIAVKIASLGLCGVYRGAWEYVGILDVYRIIAATVLGDAVLLTYGTWRVPALAQSHGFVYIDALCAAALVLSSRLSFRSLDVVRRWLQLKGDRVLIYGADEGGELALRELMRSQALRLRPVCFLDDDVRRQGAEIHGVPIVAGFDGLAWAVSRYRIDKVVIGTRTLAPEAVAVIRALAQSLGLSVAEIKFGLEWLVPVATAAAAAAPDVTPASGAMGGDGNGGATPGNGHGRTMDVRAAG